jgi:hypothetical protein
MNGCIRVNNASNLKLFSYFCAVRNVDLHEQSVIVVHGRNHWCFDSHVEGKIYYSLFGT